MLKSIRKNYNEVFQILQSRNELNKIQDIHVNCLDESIAFLEQSHRPTLHLCYPYYFDLYNKCQLDGSESILMKTFKKNEAENMKNIWEKEITNYHIAATFLFPVCKKLPMLSAEEKELVYSIIVTSAEKPRLENRSEGMSASSSATSVVTDIPNSIFSAFSSPEQILPTATIVRGIANVL